MPSASPFATTHWSVVLAAREGDSPRALTALETLCRTYWYPLYAYLRRAGHSPDVAADLTQDFFAHLLRRDFLRNVAPEKGKFRSFLLVCLRHFLCDQRDRDRALARRGAQQTITLDKAEAEERYAQAMGDPATPETLYERHWAMTLLEGARDRLLAEYRATGKAELFDRLKPFPLGEAAEVPYRAAALELGMSEGAVKSAVHRMRRRYGELLREEVAQTVLDAAEVEAEIRHLIAVIGR